MHNSMHNSMQKKQLQQAQGEETFQHWQAKLMQQLSKTTNLYFLLEARITVE